MRKVISILLCVLFIFNTLGFTFIYLLSKEYIHNETTEQIKALTSNGTICTISFPANELNYKITKEKEFVFENSMYDVITTRIATDSIYVICIKDDAETNLELAYLNFLLNNNIPNQSSKNLKNILHNLGFAGFTEFYEYNNTIAAKLFVFTENYNIKSIFKEIILPPPKYFLEKNFI